MKRKPPAGAAQQEGWLPSVFAGLFGVFLGLALLKFGNPCIMEKWVSAPTNGYEFFLGYPWPIAWAYWLLALVVAAGVMAARWRLAAPWWLMALPLVWLVWQFLAGVQSADAGLTGYTLKHFGACVLCLYLGFFSLSRVRNIWPFWAGLAGGFLLVLAIGWEQHFGGLQETRRYFYAYVYPQWKEVPPEYLKRISSNRIFSTLFYPNALAGSLLLLLPATLATIWQTRELLTAPARLFLMGLVGAAGLACLYWSGSKGGWLLMLLLGLIALLRLPFRKEFKAALIAVLLLAGLAGFFWKHSAFFQKGATSVSARFDYWQAAIHTVRDKPLFGTGPGTFSIAYEKLKRPESEMSRLVHNDYLEQASDSGVAGFLAYGFFVVWALVRGFSKLNAPPTASPEPALLPTPRLLSREHREAKKDENDSATRFLAPAPKDWQAFAVWLGVLGWSLQSFVEFGLYIPALAWPAFAFLGWLLGQERPSAFKSSSPLNPRRADK